MGYLTVDELKARNVIQPIKDCVDDIRLSELIEYGSIIIDSFVAKTFTNEESLTVFVDGDGSKKLALAKRIHIIKQVQYVAYDDTTVLMDVATLKIVDKNLSIFSPILPFPIGQYNIEVTGDFGWAQVPNDVLSCLVILCNGNFESFNDAETLQHRMSPFQSEKIGNYSYTLRAKILAEDSDQIETTGDELVDQILYKYKDSEFSMGVI